MEKFTKGEWVISADKIGVRDTSDTQSYGMIQEVCWIEEIFYSSEESKANAYLITAAPEMYEMLKGVRSEMHTLINMVNEQMKSEVTSHTENEPDYWDMETLHLINCLLAKARGES